MAMPPRSSSRKVEDTRNDGKLLPSPLLSAPPRLHVPVICVTDKTPTPTKLLRAADEIGLFQDVELNREAIAQKGKVNSKFPQFT